MTRRIISKSLILGLSLFPLSTFADAEMFRPFEGYIDDKFSCKGASCDTGVSTAGANYTIKRETVCEHWKKQRYYHRHCGSAYVNCFYPDEDYPRYNGKSYDLRWYQRQPYYAPPR